jgi:hypothetical protein
MRGANGKNYFGNVRRANGRSDFILNKGDREAKM